MKVAGGDHLAEQLAGAEQMFLADDLVERPRTHAIGQWLSHRMPRTEKSLTVVGLAPCHCEDVSTDREMCGTRGAAISPAMRFDERNSDDRRGRVARKSATVIAMCVRTAKIGR